MMQASQARLQRPIFYLTALAALYFLFNAITQYAASPTADLDQAEQLILSQTWQLGYNAQPPLYTYITKLFFYITQSSLISLYLIKVIILTCFVLSLLKITQALNGSKTQIVIVFYSIALIPQFIWESQRDLTHSVLASLMAALTLLITVKLKEKQTWTLYSLLGVVSACGLLSKYNYIIFLAALFITALISNPYRKIIFNKFILISIVLFLVLLTPHIYWIVNHLDIALESTEKLRTGLQSPLQGIAKMLTASLAFLSPLVLIMWLIIKPRLKKWQEFNSTQQFFITLSIFILITMLIFIFITHTTQIKDRWFQPILFFFILIPALFYNKPYFLRYYIGSGMLIALLVSLILPGRTLLANYTNHTSRPNMPYPTLLSQIQQNIPEANTILAETQLIAGNSLPIFSNIQIILPKYQLSITPVLGKALIICETENCHNTNFQSWLTTRFKLDSTTLTYRKFSQPYYYYNKASLNLYVAVVNLTSSESSLAPAK
jgi:4-amino-4-deoxy-L-arabinose transferase-like glycosyltransferase